ncbi:MAG: hypothetical protein HUU06_13795 [Planctomycetaceae bacterium]|nr:hypothetical protein [Planctomycetota bacterium]NUN53841.1 hypothetical protein [Planctomycetaceae bacterium]
MIDRLPRAALAAALALLLPCVPVPAAQDGAGDKKEDPAKPDAKPEEGKKAEPKKELPPAPSEEEAKEFLKTFEETLKKMTDEDAIAGVEKLRGWYAHPETSEDVRKDILAAYKKVCDLRTREALVEATAKSMAEFGEKAVDLLKFVTGRAIEQKVPSPGIVRAGLGSLGKIASPKPADVKFLTELLKKDDEFIGDAARALAGYAKAPGAIRRDIFEEMLKMSEGVFSKSEANDQPAKRRWNIWGTEVVEAMQKVTHTSWTKPPEFRKWFNDKGEGGGKNPRTWADAEPAK